MIPHSQPYITTEQGLAVQQCINESMVSRGARTLAFEQAHAQLLNKQHAIACGSGTQALIAIFKHLKIGQGDEVILPTYVCHKVADAVLAVQAKPVLCDINQQWVMSPETVESKITANTKAIILVHIFGIDAWNTEFLNFKIPIIEDICQATGKFAGNAGPGSYTSFAFTSFHGTKVITTGQGGMAFCNNSQAQQEIKNILKQQFHADFSDLQAALGLAQLQGLPNNLAQRKAISEAYLSQLQPSLTLQTKQIHSMFFRFPVVSTIPYPEARALFEKQGISIRQGVDSLIHQQWNLPNADFPNATQLYNTTLSLPILPQLSPSQVQHVVQVSNTILGRQG